MYSILWNAACPARIVFHICHLKDYRLDLLLTFFPYIHYRSYVVDGALMAGAIRGMEYRGKDLENPLNYVRINLPYMIPECIQKLIYLDTDTLMLGRVEDLYATDLERAVIGSPEFCEYKLQSYFTDRFWANRTLSQKFDKLRDACYFNPGVLVINAPAWRAMKATNKLLYWMQTQKASAAPLYTLGSLPPFLLVFAGQVAHVSRAWNEHDLGCNCAVLAPGKAHLMHWSCGDKPWRRIRSGAPCLIDTHYWQPFDLMGKVQDRNWCDDGEPTFPTNWPACPSYHQTRRMRVEGRGKARGRCCSSSFTRGAESGGAPRGSTYLSWRWQGMDDSQSGSRPVGVSILWQRFGDMDVLCPCLDWRDWQQRGSDGPHAVAA